LPHFSNLQCFDFSGGGHTVLVSCSKTEYIPEKTFANANDIFKSLNGTQLKSIQDTHNELAANSVIVSLSKDVASYMKSKYKVDVHEYFDNDIQIVQTGLVFVYLEQNAASQGLSKSTNGTANVMPISVNKMSESENCLYGTLTGMLGIPQIKAIAADFASGAVATTILGTLRVMLARTFAAFTVACAVYSLGDCLGWW
jgi:hypothetical protein